MQAANAIFFAGSVREMPKAPPALAQPFRQIRLQALLDHPDFRSKAALGRALGLSSGAYVRQMLAGERAISEKLIERVHTMQGGKFAGWFDEGAPSAPGGISDRARRVAELLDRLGAEDSPAFLQAYADLRHVLDLHADGQQIEVTAKSSPACHAWD